MLREERQAWLRGRHRLLQPSGLYVRRRHVYLDRVMIRVRWNCKLVLVGLVLLCALGAWISAQLVKEHAGPWPNTNRTPGLFARLCGEGSDGQSGCDAVLKSNWSAFDITVPVVTSSLTLTRQRVVVPVAFVGLAYFTFLGVWFAFAGRSERWGRWYAVPLLAVIAGVCGSFALLWVMLIKLDSPCTWCIITHAINGLVLLGILAMWPRRRARLAGEAPQRWRGDGGEHAQVTLTGNAALRIIGFAVVVVVGLWMYRGAKLETRRQVAKLLPYKEFVDQRMDDPAFLVREYFAQPECTALAESARDDGAPAGAVPVVTIFTDFQCGHCACFAHKWKREYLPHWRGPIRVSLRHLPFSRACNDRVTSDSHPEACDASYAAEAARVQGGDEAFWKMHDLLFAATPRLATKPYKRLATRIGLDGELLLRDMERETVRKTVVRDVALAAELGVRGTPSVFLNERRVPDHCLNNSIFWKAISAVFQRTGRVATLSDGCEKPEATPDEDALAGTDKVNR